MFEQHHPYLLESLLPKRYISAVLDEIVHESAEVELVGQDLFVDYLKTINVELTFRKERCEG